MEEKKNKSRQWKENSDKNSFIVHMGMDTL